MENEDGIPLRCHAYLALILVLFSLPLCWGQKPTSEHTDDSSKPVPSKNLPPAAAPTPIPNGISVGRPKVFDNRTLTLMLESLSESLRNSQTSLINQQSLVAALGFIQGFRTSEFSSVLNVSGLPVPGLKQETISTAGNATATGTPLPDTLKQTTTSERAAINPTTPTLDTLPAFSGLNRMTLSGLISQWRTIPKWAPLKRTK